MLMKRMLLYRQRHALLTTCLTLLLGLSASATQRIQYNYDAAGNRVLRKTAIQAFTQAKAEASIYDDAAQNAAAAHANTLEVVAPKAQITVYPNPTHGLLVVDIADSDRPAQALLYDISGALVGQWAVSSGSNTLDIGRLLPGIYIVHVVQGKESAKSWRIVKK
jgi:YD repeat-containing protein